MKKGDYIRGGFYPYIYRIDGDPYEDKDGEVWATCKIVYYIKAKRATEDKSKASKKLKLNYYHLITYEELDRLWDEVDKELLVTHKAFNFITMLIKDMENGK